MNNEQMITRTNDSRFNERDECAGCDHRPDAVHFHSPNPHLANRHSLGFPCHSLNPSFLSLSSILTGSAGLARITSLGFCALSVLTGSKETHLPSAGNVQFHSSNLTGSAGFLPELLLWVFAPCAF
jgi:hypothetical protein